MSNIYPEDGSQAPGMHPEPETQTSPPKLKEQVGAVRDRVRGEAASFAATAREKAAGAVEQRQHQVTGAIGDFADAIRKAGDELTERNQTMAAQMVRQAADGLEGISRSLEGKRPADMLHSVRDFGRRNPAAFIGGSLLIGLAIGRFIRSSMPESEYDDAEGFAAPEWEGGAIGASSAGMATSGLDANSEAFDADSADLTMSPEGAGVMADDDLDSGLDDDEFGAAGDETGVSGSPTRGM